MKRMLAYVSILVFILLASPAAIAQEDKAAKVNVKEVPEVKIIINGNEIKPENIPIDIGDRVLLPLRDVMVNLGVPNDDDHIIWEPKTQGITILNEGKEIKLGIGKREAEVNNIVYVLDVLPIIHKNRTYIPLRFVAESMDKEVAWDPGQRAAIITDKGETAAKEAEEVFRKAVDAMNGLKRYKTTANVTVKADEKNKSAAAQYDANITRNIELDMEKSSYSKEILWKQETKEIKLYEYLIDNYVYSKCNTCNTGWRKYDAGQSVQGMVYSNIECDIIRYVRPEYFKQFTVDKELSNEQQTVLSGNIYSDAFRYKNLLFVPQTVKATPKSYNIKLFIDNKTGYLLKTMAEVIYEVDSDNSKVTLTVSEAVEYSAINGESTIVLPDDAKTAVDESIKEPSNNQAGSNAAENNKEILDKVSKTMQELNSFTINATVKIQSQNIEGVEVKENLNNDAEITRNVWIDNKKKTYKKETKVTYKNEKNEGLYDYQYINNNTLYFKCALCKAETTKADLGKNSEEAIKAFYEEEILDGVDSKYYTELSVNPKFLSDTAMMFEGKTYSERLKQRGLFYIDKDAKLTFKEAVSMGVVIDKKTNYLLKTFLVAKYEYELDKDKTELIVTEEVNYSNFNTDFEITPPAGIKVAGTQK